MAGKNPKYDDSRIADFPDKETLAYVGAYFQTFTDPSPENMRDFQTEDYTMTDIRTSGRNSHVTILPLASRKTPASRTPYVFFHKPSAFSPL